MKFEIEMDQNGTVQTLPVTAAVSGKKTSLETKMKMTVHVQQKIAFTLLGIASAIVIVPVIVIFAILIQKGLPAINWEFLSSMPRMGMRAGAEGRPHPWCAARVGGGWRTISKRP